MANNNDNNNNNNNGIHTCPSQCMKRELSQCCGINTDREVTANRPDIIIKNKKKEKTCTLTGVAIPADRNVVQKEAEKKLTLYRPVLLSGNIQV